MPLPRIDPGHYQGRQTARCLARQHDLETQIVPSRALGPEGASSGYRGEMVLHAEPEESGGAAQGTRNPAGAGPSQVGDPGLEPGTSSLSEKRSNRLS